VRRQSLQKVSVIDEAHPKRADGDIKTEWEKNYGHEKDNCAQDGTHRPQDGTEGGARYSQDGTEGGARYPQDGATVEARHSAAIARYDRPEHPPKVDL
jgi:hypothetical protein